MRRCVADEPKPFYTVGSKRIREHSQMRPEPFQNFEKPFSASRTPLNTLNAVQASLHARPFPGYCTLYFVKECQYDTTKYARHLFDTAACPPQVGMTTGLSFAIYPLLTKALNKVRPAPPRAPFSPFHLFAEEAPFSTPKRKDHKLAG